jgi:hypothetical protein
MAHARLHLIWLMLACTLYGSCSPAPASARVLMLMLAFARVLILMLAFARVLILILAFARVLILILAFARVLLKNFRVLRALTLRVCSLQRLAPAAKN